MEAFTHREKKLFQKLSTPQKVQDFLNTIAPNKERDGKDTIKSPLRVLREKNAHCIEGAIFAAYVLSLHGYKPFLVHMKATRADLDHVIFIFKEKSGWGAISKTNHAVLRFREPIYKNLRELVMSYFHEYTTDDGKKTLRSYSVPLDLSIFEKGWETEMEDLWGIDEELDAITHIPIGPSEFFKKMRLSDEIEREVGKMLEWKK